MLHWDGEVKQNQACTGVLLLVLAGALLFLIPLMAAAARQQQFDLHAINEMENMMQYR
jgi:hypothetical protein